MQQVQDSVHDEWKAMLSSYPPLLTPKQVQEASLGIVRANDIYSRGQSDSKRLDLDVRTIGGRLFITRNSLAVVLAGKQELPL